MARGRKKRKNRRACPRKPSVKVVDENNLDGYKSDPMKDDIYQFESFSGKCETYDVVSPSNVDETLKGDALNVNRCPVDSLSCNNRETVACSEKESEFASSPTTVSQKTSRKWAHLKLVEDLNKLFDEMHRCQEEGDPTPVDPSVVFSTMEFVNPSFRFGDQQDVHEFFSCLLSTLQDVVKEINLLRNEVPCPAGGSMGADAPPTHSAPNPARSCNMTSELSNDFSELVLANQSHFKEESALALSNNSVTIINRPKGGPDLIVSDFVSEMFQGVLERVTRCMECESESKSSEAFLNLLLPLKWTKEMPLISPIKVECFGGSNMPCSGDDCTSDDEEDDDDSSKLLRCLSNVERLRDENKFHCLVCNHMVEAEQRTRFIKCPHVVVFHLQRFAQVHGMGVYSKLTENSGIPMEMRCLEEECKEVNHRLKLFALISHSGFSTTSGHYITYVNSSIVETRPGSFASSKLPPMSDPPPAFQMHHRVEDATPNNAPLDANKSHFSWLELNDHMVKKMGQEELERITKARSSSNNPYMLFYCRT